MKKFFRHPGTWFALTALVVLFVTRNPNEFSAYLTGAFVGVSCYFIAMKDKIHVGAYHLAKRDRKSQADQQITVSSEI